MSASKDFRESSGWVDVTRREPCAICDGRDWCRVSNDGRALMCRRVFDAPGARLKQDARGVQYAVYFTDDGLSRDHVTWTPPPEPDCADLDTLDRVYRDLLARMPLLFRHRSMLQKERGIDAESVDRMLFRSLGPGAGERARLSAAMRETHGKDLLVTVPGFYAQGERVMLGGDSGLIIPLMDAQARVVALKVRRDDPVDEDQPRYRSISSASHGGPGPHAPAHVPLVPGARTDTLCVTEGEFKAAITTLRTGILTVSVPGASHIAAALPIIEQLRPSIVRLAWDADKRKRHTRGETNVWRANGVAGGLQAAMHKLTELDIAFEVLDWPEALGKGIDDVLLAGHADAIVYHAGVAAWDHLVEVLTAAGNPVTPEVAARASSATRAQTDTTSGKGSSSRADTGQSPPSGAAPEADRVQPPGQGGIFERGDSPELAKRLLEDLRDGSPETVVHDAGRFWRYDPKKGIWLSIDEDAAYCLVGDYSESWWVRGRDGAVPLKLTDQAITGALKAARKYASKKGFFNDAKTGVTFSNAFVEVDPVSGAIVKHSLHPDQRSRYALDFDYDLAAKRDAWTSFFETAFDDGEVHDTTKERDPDVVKEIDLRSKLCEEVVGATLFGLATRYAKCFVLFGPLASNGKSTFVNALEKLFSEDTRTAIEPSEWSERFVLSEMVGKKVNFCSELPDRKMQNNHKFKAVVSGDMMRAEIKNHQGFTFRPTAGHFCLTNNTPPTEDTTEGFWRRFIVIAWNRHFDETNRDHQMKDKLIAQLAGFAVSCVEGASRLVKNNGKYTTPDSSRFALDDWKEDADQVRLFVKERCVACDAERKINVETPLIELYADYTDWVASTGQGRLSRSSFGARLRSLGHYRRTKEARLYKLALLPKVEQKTPGNATAPPATQSEQTRRTTH